MGDENSEPIQLELGETPSNIVYLDAQRVNPVEREFARAVTLENEAIMHEYLWAVLDRADKEYRGSLPLLHVLGTAKGQLLWAKMLREESHRALNKALTK